MFVKNNHGATDDKFRLLENHIKEVQTGAQILRDEQEIAEAHSQLIFVSSSLLLHQTIPPIISPSRRARYLHPSTSIVPKAPSYQSLVSQSATTPCQYQAFQNTSAPSFYDIPTIHKAVPTITFF